MSHDAEPTRDRRDLIADIKDAADALTDVHQHSEPRWEWDTNRNRKPLKPHTTTVPGLIQQLREAASPGVDGESGGAGGPESCPVAIDAVSLLASIEFGAALRCRQVGLAIRPTAEDNLRALVGAAPRLPSRSDADQPGQASQWTLRAELRSWQHQAEVITQWKTPARPLPAPCPQCDARGVLLARVGPEVQQAVCVACDTRWDGEAEMAILGRHVSEYRTRADAAAAAARTRAAEERRRREGRPVDGHGQGRSAA